MTRETNGLELVSVQKTGYLLNCPRKICLYKWVYTGHRTIGHTICPKCGTSVMLTGIRK